MHYGKGSISSVIFQVLTQYTFLREEWVIGYNSKSWAFADISQDF